MTQHGPLIHETHVRWSARDNAGQELREIEYYEVEQMRDLLVGHRVERVNDDHLELDNGTMVKVVGNEGCGGCAAGWYEVTSVSGVDNVITSVSVETEVLDKYGEGHTYRIFVFCGEERLNLATITGDDGNGYYGTGFHLLVRAPIVMGELAEERREIES